jgi:hypothetical protein
MSLCIFNFMCPVAIFEVLPEIMILVALEAEVAGREDSGRLRCYT